MRVLAACRCLAFGVEDVPGRGRLPFFLYAVSVYARARHVRVVDLSFYVAARERYWTKVVMTVIMVMGDFSSRQTRAQTREKGVRGWA